MDIDVLNGISLKCRDVVLRPMDESKDLDLLFKWRNDFSGLFLWMPEKYPVSREEFIDEMKRRYQKGEHTRFMINVGDKTVGTIFSYDYSLVNGWLYVATYIQPEHQANGFGAIAWGLFAEYLFSYWPIRKIYCNVYEFNHMSLSTQKSGGLEEEARLSKHIHWNGEYHDCFTMSLTRERFDEVVKQRLDKWRSNNQQPTET